MKCIKLIARKYSDIHLVKLPIWYKFIQKHTSSKAINLIQIHTKMSLTWEHIKIAQGFNINLKKELCKTKEEQGNFTFLVMPYIF